MTPFIWLQIGLYLIVLLLLVKPLGSFMARVYEGERTFLSPVLSPVERFIYRLIGVKPQEEMDWKTYAFAMLLFSLVGLITLWTATLTGNTTVKSPEPQRSGTGPFI
jgi:K+-transporting ATPase ATPase A chain